MTATASWDPDYLTIEKQMELSGIVVAGTVVKIDAPRCNSPDGKEWSPPEDQTLPIVYTTFYVEPAQILKGTPEWGTPVAFRVTGNTQEGDLQLSVGEKIVVFGTTQARYGPGGVYQPAGAYWLTEEENSAWVEGAGVYTNQGHTKDPAERALSLEALKDRVASFLPAPATTPSSLPPTAAPTMTTTAAAAPTTTTTAIVAPTTTSTVAAGSASRVEELSSGLQPVELTVDVGQTVTWKNADSVAHQVISDNGLFDSGKMAPGATYTFTFTKVGRYQYHCTGGPAHYGTIVARPQNLQSIGWLRLDMTPRAGVRVAAGGLKQTPGSHTVLGEIIIANKSDTPFFYKADDFGIYADDARFSAAAIPPMLSSGRVDPGQTLHGHLLTWQTAVSSDSSGLSYDSSDSASAGFNQAGSIMP